MASLLDALSSDPYQGYAYAYPHKVAYERLAPEVELTRAWADEPRDELMLYVHIPVCEMRCGFCNLFTVRTPADDFEPAYLAALERQTERVLSAVGPSRFRAAAIGGGTPTQLSLAGLARVLELMVRAGADPSAVPVSVETSPRTADPERLALLAGAGVQRISIGVQSFDDRDTRALGRPQQRAWVLGALERIREHRFPVLNVDLIYGGEGQTETRLIESLDAALAYAPEELYLYPLYVRPLTGLGKKGSRLPLEDARVGLYRAARARLIDAGYEQISMRFFRRAGTPGSPDTSCQEDGTIGLGCGARSYTRALHYAFEWATDQGSIKDILRAYIEAPAERFERAHHGFALSMDEQRRRYAIKSLLRADGLALDRYQHFFGSDALADLTELPALIDAGLVAHSAATLQLTERGMELSDAIGPYLYSPEVRARIALHEAAPC